MNRKQYLTILLTASFTVFQSPLQAQVIEDPDPPSAVQKSSGTKIAPKVAHYSHQNLLYGYYTETEWVVPPIYTKLDREYSDFMVAEKNGKVGVIDRLNRPLVPFEYDKIYKKFKDPKNLDKRKWKGWYIIEKNGKKGLLEGEGTIKIPAQYDYLNRLEENLYSVGSAETGYGLVDLDNKVVLDFNFDGPIATRDKTSKIYQTKKNGKTGWINQKGEVVLPFEYDELTQIKLSEKRYYKYKKGLKWGFMTLDGGVLTPPIYETFKIMGKDLLIVSQNKKYGILDSDFNEKVPMSYSRIERLSKRYLKLRIGEDSRNYKYGVIDTLGKVILDLKYKKYIVSGPSDLIFAQRIKEEQPYSYHYYSIYDGRGNEIRSPTYTSVQRVGNYFSVSLSQQNAEQESALMNSEAEVLTPYIYHRFEVRKKRGSDNEVIIYAIRGRMRGTLEADGSENNDFKPY